MNNIIIEHARIAFPNFSGAPGRFNPAGNRNFCVLIEDKNMAEGLKADGWNVKYLRPRDEYDEPMPYLQVAVSYKVAPPKIVLVSSNGKTTLDEEELNILDFAQFTNVDMIIRPYNYNVSGTSGIKAYLKSLYVTLYEDELERKYMNVPDSAQNSIVPKEEY